MLLLTRRPGQTFRIGEEIEIKVLEVNGNSVHIGVTAPKEVKIFRGELLPTGKRGRRSQPSGGSDETPQNTVA